MSVFSSEPPKELTTMTRSSQRLVASPRERGNSQVGFTLSDLLVLTALVSLLAVLPFAAHGNGRTRSRSLSCLNNLRQLGVAMHLYVADYRQYPGCLSVTTGYAYVWPQRLLGETSGQRQLFSCPAAPPNSWWDTNLNSTLGGTGPTGFDPYTVRNTSRFSFGYNDWGLSINQNLGLGGDINGGFASVVTEAKVLAPSQLIALGDLPATQNPAAISFNANLDPTDSAPSCQRPGNRHAFRTDLLFADGHTEAPWRNDIISPAATNPWRARWNNDNKPHTELKWTISNTSQLEP